ncbi:substrate-binding domain-containing protein [Danxiaibacter flavus]|uniref:Substrate-binding domain-containing protein n=1 Tax=Danxiaibacter flavus TaxID=3049108 RepID=A0ABV3ZB08_9BACT|nr:substrate-binding domain-containing protein [Chitinophagaceae bacterium DXS]
MAEKIMCKLAVAFFLGVIFTACGNGTRSNRDNDTYKKGVINISVDESFKPVIEEQIKVYESSFPEAKIIPTYKSEADCLRDLQNDSVRMIVIARGLTVDEDKYYTTKLKYHPNYDVLAYDAVSVIININGKDSVFTMAKIRDFLSGKDSSKTIVVDGKNATSTVRFLKDSVLKGENFGSNVTAANNSREVVDYVSRNQNAIGFVGSSWVGNEQDPEQKAYMKTIRFALLQCTSCKDDSIFAKPSQSTISYAQYPLVRPLYYIVKENYSGLGTGFLNFMSVERGQLIFRRSYLVPAKMYFGIRTSNIKESTD